MLNLDSIAVDPSLAKNGVWADFLGGRFLLARRGPEYQERLSELYQQNLDLCKSNTPEGNAKSMEIFKQVFAEKQLLDWDKIVDKEGNPIPYTPELGFKLMMDPRQFELVNFLETFTLIQTNYQEAAQAEIASDVKDTAVS